MRLRFLVILFAGLVLLNACSPANDPTFTSTAAVLVQQTTTAVESIGSSSTSAPQPDPTATNAGSTDDQTGEPAATDAPPSRTQQPEPTEIAIALTDTPQPEPTATTLPEPTVTAILCSGVLTSPNQEGPYYSLGSPERSSLIDDGMDGVPIVIIGRVFDQNCDPVAGAKLDFWLADVNGEYDNVGYTLRGHVFSDENGNYTLESIEPTPYTGRPPHIHAKVFGVDGRELLTTQLYFSGSEVSSDVSASPDLLATYLEPDDVGRQQALFNFIVLVP